MKYPLAITFLVSALALPPLMLTVLFGPVFQSSEAHAQNGDSAPAHEHGV